MGHEFLHYCRVAFSRVIYIDITAINSYHGEGGGQERIALNSSVAQGTFPQ